MFISINFLLIIYYIETVCEIGKLPNYAVAIAQYCLEGVMWNTGSLTGWSVMK